MWKKGRKQKWNYNKFANLLNGISARYIAGKAIIINANILKIQVYDWVLELVKRRKGTITVIRKFKVGGHYENRPVKMPSKNALRAHQDLVEMYKILPFRKYRFGISKLLSKSRDEFLADEVLRGTKVNEFELKTVYSSRAVSEKARLAAARKLGYSSFKMWKDQHPFQSVFLIIFSVVLYLLVLCFSIIRIINSLLIYGW